MSARTTGNRRSETARTLGAYTTCNDREGCDMKATSVNPIWDVDVVDGTEVG
jgi:hypothetical protein